MNHTPKEASSQPRLYIAGMGMITSVGSDTAMTAAAVKAGISAYAESQYHNEQDQLITMASIPDAIFAATEAEIEEGDRYNEQQDHIVKMAIVALGEACAGQPIEKPIPLILAMPETPSQAKQITPSKLIRNLVHNCQPWINPELSRSLHSGRAAGVEALDFAYRYLYETYGDYLLIGGSDSYRHYARLDPLDAAGRLLAPGSQDSFAPGEAAAFLLLTRDPEKAMVRDGHILGLGQPGLAQEAGHLFSDEPYRGDGLDQAFKQALVGGSNPAISSIYSSMNGERHWAKELGVAQLRNRSAFRDPLAIEHPADAYGDIGSATAPALIALAANELLETPGARTHLVYSSSDYGLRGAVLVEKLKAVQEKIAEKKQ